MREPNTVPAGAVSDKVIVAADLPHAIRNAYRWIQGKTQASGMVLKLGRSVGATELRWFVTYPGFTKKSFSEAQVARMREMGLFVPFGDQPDALTLSFKGLALARKGVVDVAYDTAPSRRPRVVDVDAKKTSGPTLR